MQAVVLSSGGLDSSLTMLLLRNRGTDVYPLHVNYGQLAESREWAASRRVCRALRIRPPERMDLPGFQMLPSGLVNRRLDIHDNAFLPTRNLMFLVAGAAYAFSKGIDIVAIGLVDNPIFPDQTREFVSRSEDAISTALARRMKILSPLIRLDKREVIQLAAKSHLDFGLTYYCHSGKDKPCGKCISCRERMAAEESLAQNEQRKTQNVRRSGRLRKRGDSR